jgi:hypothetical protein
MQTCCEPESSSMTVFGEQPTPYDAAAPKPTNATPITKKLRKFIVCP